MNVEGQLASGQLRTRTMSPGCINTCSKIDNCGIAEGSKSSSVQMTRHCFRSTMMQVRDMRTKRAVQTRLKVEALKMRQDDQKSAELDEAAIVADDIQQPRAFQIRRDGKGTK